TATLKVTDADGDTGQHSKTIDIGDKLKFGDTGPSIGTPDNAVVYESNLDQGSTPTGNPVVATGSLNVNFGNDNGPGTDVYFTAATVERLEGLSLTSGGAKLKYTLDDTGHVLTATADGRAVFKVEITNPNKAEAGYKFTLQGMLDHVDMDGEGLGTLDVVFPFTVKDSDGDTAGKEFTVTVDDDRNTIDQTITLDEDSSYVIHTSADATPESIRIYREDEDGVTEVTAVDGVYQLPNGTITIDPETGHLTYTPTPNYSNYGGADVFHYSVAGKEGVPSFSKVTVNVTPVADAPDLGDAPAAKGHEDTWIL